MLITFRVKDFSLIIIINNNININKIISYKLNSSPQPVLKEKNNYYKPDTDYLKECNRNIKINNNLLLNFENEKINNEDKTISKKTSFNESNLKKNYYKKSYNSSKSIKINYKKGSNNLNTINF